MHDISNYSEWKYGLFFADVLYQVLTSKKVDHILANQSYLLKLYFELWDNKESSKENCGENLYRHVYGALWKYFKKWSYRVYQQWITWMTLVYVH